MRQTNKYIFRKSKMTMQTVIWKFRDCSDEFPILKDKEKIDCPESIYEQFRPLFENEVREKFVVFWLSTANKVMGFEVVSIGNLNSAIVHPREVYRGAIVASCNSIIIAHNHPSGNPKPSEEDIKMTHEIEYVGRIIGIKLLDHIIFTNNGYSSLRERSELSYKDYSEKKELEKEALQFLENESKKNKAQDKINEELEDWRMRFIDKKFPGKEKTELTKSEMVIIEDLVEKLRVSMYENKQ